MGLRLIRQKSDTPNVLNTDDSRMTRYAYGGYNGVVKNRGSECNYTTSGTTFKINSGTLVLQGWEVDIDSNGWEMQIDSLAKYYIVYLEINLATDRAEIKSVYSTTGFIDFDDGDDLTQTINGTARMLLYTFFTSGSTFLQVTKKFDTIKYLKDIEENNTDIIIKILDGQASVGVARDYGDGGSKGTIKQKFDEIDQRLDELGFKTGSVTGLSSVTLSKMGKYAIISGFVNKIGQQAVSEYVMSFTAKQKTVLAKGIYTIPPTSNTYNWQVYVENNKLIYKADTSGTYHPASVEIYSGGFEII